jgi:MFS family permease
MWSITVVLPTLQADFGVTRADVSLAYTAVMLGAVVGGPGMGWLSDRFGITVPVAIGTVMLALGLALASQAATQAARHQPDGVCLPAPHKVAAGLGPGVEG